MPHSTSSTTRHRLLVLSSTFPRWENDTEPPFVFELCKRLSKDFDITALTPHAPGAKLDETIEGIRIVRFRYFFEWGESLCYHGGIVANLRANRFRYLLIPFFFIFQFIALARHLRHETYSAIHAHWIIPQGITTVLVRPLIHHMPAFVCTSHGSDLYALDNPLFSLIRRSVINHADSLTVVSEAMRARLCRHSSDRRKIHTIPMGIDCANRFSPGKKNIRSDHCEILFVGRLSREKGPETLLRAIPQLLERNLSVSVTVIGNGPDENFLKNLCTRLAISNSVSFLGTIRNDEVPAHYQRASMFVFPSITTEGFGLTCAEALACERPVLASDIAACNELIKDGKTGILFRAGDHNDLAEKIILLFSNPSFGSSIAREGRALVEANFDWQVIARKYRDLIDEAIHKKAC